MKRTIILTLAFFFVMGVFMWVWAQAGEVGQSPPKNSLDGVKVFSPSEIAWTPGPPSLPDGAQYIILEGNPRDSAGFTMRLKFPAGYKLPPHRHPADEHVTIISGTLCLGQGKSMDEKKCQKLSAGSFWVMPAWTHHYTYVRTETVVQLHGTGPWGIDYLNKADDPTVIKQPGK